MSEVKSKEGGRWLRWIATAVAAIVVVGSAAESSGAPPEISLVTMDPGYDPFSVFGHAAVCVKDELYPEGVCYNYGTADFNKPIELGWAVLQGRADFFVSTWKLRRMSRIYEREDRNIYTQVLPLGPERAAAARAKLASDARPENKRYRYDHFYENCSTRPRDHIDAWFDGRLSAASAAAMPHTYRHLVRRGFSHSAPLAIASELFLGRAMDRHPSGFEAMFLPEFLRESIARDLRVPTTTSYRAKNPYRVGDPLVGQRWLWSIAIVLGGLGAVISFLGGHHWVGWLGRLFPVLVIFLAALVLTLLVVLSPTPELRYNELVLVILPTDLLALWKGRAVRTYLSLRVAMLISVALLAALGLFVQPLWAPWFMALVTLGTALAVHRFRKPREASTT